MARLGGRCGSPVSDGDSLDQDSGDGDGENWTVRDGICRQDPQDLNGWIWG